MAAVSASGLAMATPALAATCGETFSGGDGSSGTPYLISEAADVTALKGDFNCWASGTYFEQTADIDMGGITWTDHAIGYNNPTRPFEGNYNGGGYEISGLNIDFTGSDSSSFDNGYYAGFFGDLEGNVSNLGFTGSVSGTYYVGGLVGYLGNAREISNSYATGNVTASQNTVGGLVGWLFAGNVVDSYATGSVNGKGTAGGLIGYSNNASNEVRTSYATGTVTSAGDYAGGLIAHVDNGVTVIDSYATGAVTSTAGGNIGGLIGRSEDSTVSSSYATGAVTASVNAVGGLIGGTRRDTVESSFATGAVSSDGNAVGGLIGTGFGGTVRDSYATGAVSGNEGIGGLFGQNGNTVRRSYSIGPVTGNADFGGLVGDALSDSNIQDTVFWNTTTSGLDDGFGSNNSSPFNAVGASTSQMQTLSTFTDAGWTSIADSWVSSNTWGICEGSGYPYLTWQYTSTDDACGGGSAPAASSAAARYTFTFLTSTGGVCFVDDNVAAGAYALPTSQVACTPEGTELVGWSVPGQVGAFSDGGIVTASGDQTFTAVAKDPNIEVTFDPNVGADTACLLEGSDVELDQREVARSLPRGGAIGEVDICAPAGHILAGWTDRPTTNGPYAPVQGATLMTTGTQMPVTWNHDPNPVNSIRLYAVWSKEA